MMIGMKDWVSFGAPIAAAASLWLAAHAGEIASASSASESHNDGEKGREINNKNRLAVFLDPKSSQKIVNANSLRAGSSQKLILDPNPTSKTLYTFEPLMGMASEVDLRTSVESSCGLKFALGAVTAAGGKSVTASKYDGSEAQIPPYMEIGDAHFSEDCENLFHRIVTGTNEKSLDGNGGPCSLRRALSTENPCEWTGKLGQETLIFRALEPAIKVSGIICTEEHYDGATHTCHYPTEAPVSTNDDGLQENNDGINQPLSTPEKQEEQAECPLCQFFRESPCSEVYAGWKACLDKVEATGGSLFEDCGEITIKLRDCVTSNSEYFGGILDDGNVDDHQAEGGLDDGGNHEQ